MRGGAKGAIREFIHCRECLGKKPPDFAPQQWSNLDIGWTEKGLQVWCNRCNQSVVSIDFQGQKVRLGP